MVSELDGYNYVWKYVECCARSRHQGQGQVIKFHSICGMYTPTAFTLYIVQMCQVSCDDIIIVPIYMHIYLHLYIATLPTIIYFGFKDHYINSHLYVGTWNINATVSILIFYCLLAHYRPRFYWCISADSRIIRYFWQTYICDMMINPKMFNNLCRLNFTIKAVFPNMYYSYHTIPYWININVCRVSCGGVFNMLLVRSITFYFHYNIWGCMCSTGPFQYRWLKGYIYSSCYHHHQIRSIHFSHCCYIFPWLCASDVCFIIFCHLLHIRSGKTGNLFSLLLCSLWWVQMVGYVLPYRSYSFICTVHHVIIIIVQDYLKTLNL